MFCQHEIKRKLGRVIAINLLSTCDVHIIAIFGNLAPIFFSMRSWNRKIPMLNPLKKWWKMYELFLFSFKMRYKRILNSPIYNNLYTRNKRMHLCVRCYGKTVWHRATKLHVKILRHLNVHTLRFGFSNLLLILILFSLE